MSISKKQYKQMVKDETTKSPMIKNIALAFLSGGIICVIAQVIFNTLIHYNINSKYAASYTTVIMIFLGALFTGIGVYDKLAKHCGAGTIVPITGFANSIVAPAMEYKSEGLIMGIGAKMFIVAGPVLVYGITASVIYGVIYYISLLY